MKIFHVFDGNENEAYFPKLKEAVVFAIEESAHKVRLEADFPELVITEIEIPKPTARLVCALLSQRNYALGRRTIGSYKAGRRVSG